MKFDNDQQAFFNRVASGGKGIIRLRGEAGTGKTTILNELKKLSVNIIWVATTAKAATHIAGKTIHSTFGVPIHGARNPEVDVRTERELDRYTRNFKYKEKVLKHVQWIIIDECSQASCDLVDFIDKAMQHAKKNRKPFGGCGVIFVGDNGQLQPIIKDKAEELEQFGYEFPFTLEKSRVVQEHGLEEFVLTEIHRQEDKVFSKALSNIRVGKQTDEDLALINTRAGIEPDEDAIIITPYNRVKDSYNERGLANLDTKLQWFNAEVKGTFLKKKPNQFPFRKSIPLKIGCRIVIKQNMKWKDEDGFEWSVINGDTGTFNMSDGHKLFITVDRLGYEIALPRYTANDCSLVVHVDEEGNKRVGDKINGSFTQFPVDLGYASTVHNAQGMSIPKVHFDLGKWNTFVQECYALAYTGLSRVTSLEGLTLQRQIQHRDVIHSPLAESPPPKQLELI